MLCSPAAKDSHWVNEEIRLFRSLHGDRAILSAIVEGTPSASFPPALTEHGHEPLAANLKQGRDSFRFGVHQLAASILGVGLDTLVQRGEKKRRVRNQLVMAGTTALAVVMSGFAFTTYNAQQAAEKSRDDAERLVEYMVSDLKSELYSLQRLDILDGLGEEIVEYYEGIDPERLPNERLVRLITAIQSLGEVAISEQNHQKAHKYLVDASALIEVLEDRQPDSSTAVFYRAQNEYWEGLSYKRQDLFEQALPFWQRYHDLGYQLLDRDPKNKKWIMEAGWGSNNLAILYRFMSKLDQSKFHAERAADLFRPLHKSDRTNLYISYEYANTLSTLSHIAARKNETARAIEINEEIVSLIRFASKNKPKDYKAELYRIQAEYDLLKLKGLSICQAPSFIFIRDEMESVYQQDKQHAGFISEYARHRFEYLDKCWESLPLKELATQIEILEELNEQFPVQGREEFIQKIKRPRAKNSEPSD